MFWTSIFHWGDGKKLIICWWYEIISQRFISNLERENCFNIFYKVIYVEINWAKCVEICYFKYDKRFGLREHRHVEMDV
jgi:hypothetical protein